MASLKRKAVKRRRQAPKTPGKPEDHGEKCLHMHCQQWLEKSGIWDRLLIFHVANERRGGIGTIMHFKRMGVLDGVADYLAFPLNRAVAIEIKDTDGEQRRGQERFQKRWEAAGHTYVIARTLEEFQGIVQALLLFC